MGYLNPNFFYQVVKISHTSQKPSARWDAIIHWISNSINLPHSIPYRSTTRYLRLFFGDNKYTKGIEDAVFIKTKILIVKLIRIVPFTFTNNQYLAIKWKIFVKVLPNLLLVLHLFLHNLSVLLTIWEMLISKFSPTMVE